ncbi:MAG: hypothetical protein CO129_10885 [Ignavibacteriales bacterium CG_4_9_14_3_um_filter_34_10]|nr:MAG: hypothetical protein CO129_10885 [Ignavibacteriales bacterium CG_4_9_14_3_um_filter_34_10]
MNIWDRNINTKRFFGRKNYWIGTIRNKNVLLNFNNIALFFRFFGFSNVFSYDKAINSFA